jgi:hypothetical protein
MGDIPYSHIRTHSRLITWTGHTLCDPKSILALFEERDDFQCPYSYQGTIGSASNADPGLSPPRDDARTSGLPDEKLETDLQGDIQMGQQQNIR